MKQRKFWLAMLVLALALGMTVVGCDDGSSDNGGDGGSIGVNELSGKMYYEYSSRTVFSETAEGASSGTYTVGRKAYDESYNDILDNNGKYTYTDEETGTYTWNEDAQTVTLTPVKVEGENGLVDKNAYRSYAQTYINQFIEQMGEEVINQYLSQMGFSSTADYIDYMVDVAFTTKTNKYSFSSDGKALFLQEALTSKGTNELSGQTYNGLTWDSSTQKYEKDTDQVYEFTASNYTFSDSSWYGTPQIETGTYAYDSTGTQKYVWFSPTTINGKDRNAYYEEQTVYGENYYIDEYAYRAARTNNAFSNGSKPYNSTNKTIGYEN